MKILKGEYPEIGKNPFWYKVIEMLQHNWAAYDYTEHVITVFFFDDGSNVLDYIEFETADQAREALIRNGFREYDDNTEAQSFISKPGGPFRAGSHPNGEIYSSGRFWK